MSDLTLVIGNKNYSSWSLRPWLAMTMAGLAFREVVIPLRQPESAEAIARYSPSGKVPVLWDGALAICESIAILEYAAELAAAAQLWPADASARAAARAVSAEMHAGFAALRSHLPMNVRARRVGRGLTPAAAGDIARICAIWRECRQRFAGDGPFLFGRFSNADSMYAPVVSRFATYGVELDAVCRSYCETILGLAAMRAWAAAAAAEPWIMANNEVD